MPASHLAIEQVPFDEESLLHNIDPYEDYYDHEDEEYDVCPVLEFSDREVLRIFSNLRDQLLLDPVHPPSIKKLLSYLLPHLEANPQYFSAHEHCFILEAQQLYDATPAH